MSAIVGHLRRDDASAEPTLLDGAMQALATFGEHPARWNEGPLAVGHWARHTTPESERETWPLIHASGFVLVADARIDNRTELIRLLRLGDSTPAPTDGDLILASHLRWGDEAPAQLVGDYAYALWQPTVQTLLLVRSVMGMRGLFYRVTPQAIEFATTLRGVAALGPRPALNEAAVASFFVQRMDRLREESLLVGIRKVPPGHSMRVRPDSGAEAPHPFWQLVPDERASWPRDQQREALRESFDQAVAATLRSTTPLTIAVSGGLDSSSVALTAHDLMHGTGTVAPQPTHTYSVVMPGWPDTDETPYREAVLARLPAFEQHVLEMHEPWTWPLAERWSRLTSVPPPFTNGYILDLAVQQAQSIGSRVIVSGLGGDLMTGGQDYGAIENLASLPWPQKWAERRHFWRSLGAGRGLLRLATNRLMPWPLQQRWRRRDGRWFLPTLSCEAAAGPPSRRLRRRAESPLQRYIREWLASPFGTFPFEFNSEIMAAHGIEMRTPYADRRLIELVYQLPAESRVGGGLDRRLFRAALAGRLPDALQQRKSKADFTDFTAWAISEADHAWAVQLGGAGWLNDKGWLDRRVWQLWATNPPVDYLRSRLHAAAHAEVWLQQWEQGRGDTLH